MKETESQCSVCHRFLTAEELEINKNKYRKTENEARCYYCYVRALTELNQSMDEQEAKFPIPSPHEFGRDQVDEEELANMPNVTSAVQTLLDAPATGKEEWSEPEIENFKNALGIDLTKKVETITGVPNKSGKRITPPAVPSPDFGQSHKLTQISARGTTEDVSLTFTVPRELLDPRLTPAIQNGLNTILLSLMNMLAFAPLHNGVMQNILQPPPPNPFGLPGGGPPNLWE